MKKILIIAPHFPPSNLAATHRSRLFAMHLPEFGWEPTILMVHEDYYEEKHDWNLVRLLPKGLRLEKVAAYKVTKPRVIGDIGLRAFRQLTAKAIELVRKEKIDFLYIPIPSFYIALIGRIVHAKTGVPYGIDYIDPWVHEFPGQDKIFSRHWFSSKLAGLLEPIAIKNAALITGVAEGYYKGVIERNPALAQKALFGAMPYGGEQEDYEITAGMDALPYVFTPNKEKIRLVYAGAMLPKAYGPLRKIFEAIVAHPHIFANVEFQFIGTGKSPNDAQGYNIKPLAEEFGLWQTIVFEHPQRIPYLDVLIHLKHAHGVFVLGSTEPHYTPSKIYQGVLSQKPVLAVLHTQSTAVDILNRSHAGIVLAFDGESELEKIKTQFPALMQQYKTALPAFNPANVDRKVFDQYSAKEVTRQLAELLNKING